MSLDTVKSQLEQAQALIASALGEVAHLLPPPVTITRVAKGGNLQAAIDAAKPGDTILVYPDLYTDVILRAKPAGAPITIAPDTTALAPGTRVDPSFLNAMIRVSSASGYSPVRTETGASNYVLRGFAPTMPGDGTPAYVAIGDGTQGDITQLPDNVVLDQCVFVADPMKGSKRGVQANCRALSILNSYFKDFFWVGQDSQAVQGYNGPGAFLIQNNYMEASGENILFGGADAVNADCIPQNLIVRGNYLTKPLAWQTMATKPLIKNTFELKNVINALIENNVIEHCWTGGQVGFLVQVTPRNQNGKAPFSTVANVVFQYNVIRAAGAGVNMLGTDNLAPSGRLSHVKFLHNLMYGIDPKALPGAARLWQISDGPLDVEIGHNTCVGDNLNSFLGISGKVTDGLNMHDNVLSEGAYGLTGANTGVGAPSWTAFTVNSAFERNLIACGTSGRNITYPGAQNYKSAAGEVVVNPDFTLIDKYAGVASTDGTPVGCNVAEVRKRVNF